MLPLSTNPVVCGYPPGLDYLPDADRVAISSMSKFYSRDRQHMLYSSKAGPLGRPSSNDRRGTVSPLGRSSSNNRRGGLEEIRFRTIPIVVQSSIGIEQNSPRTCPLNPIFKSSSVPP